MAEAIALPIGLAVANETGSCLTKEVEGAVKSIVDYIRGFNCKQNINRQQIIRDILRNLNHSYPEYNLAIVEEGVYFLNVSGGLEEVILDQKFKIEGIRKESPFEIRILIFKKGVITILSHALKDPKRWGDLSLNEINI